MALFIDDKKVGGIKELCIALKIDQNTIPYLKRTKEFAQIMERDLAGNPKRDRDGNYVTKRKIAGTPAFRVFVPGLGYEVQVRLAQTQRKEKDDFVYTPKLVSMDPAEDGTVQIGDNLEFAFWFLHPWCAQSPFHQVGSPAFYEYKDDDAASKMSNDYEESMINALGYIIGNHAKTVKQLRSIAKGLNIVGVDDMTDEVVKKTLREEAKKNPIEFVNKVDSREIIFSGQVQDAVDKGILALKNLNGMQRWYLNNKEILPVPYGTEPLDLLKDELSTKWYLYSKDITDSLNGVTIASNLGQPEHDEQFNGEVTHKINQKAELTGTQLELLKKIEEDFQYGEKIKRLASVDIEDPSLHQGTRASYNKNKEAVELYKASLLLAVPA